MLRKWGMFVLMLLAAPALVFAQNTGKIAGVVTDAGTGDPLPGAQVILVGTTLGTITDADGNYFVIGVPVGTYDVQARFVGYQENTVSGVNVSSGYTQEVNFALSEGVDLGEIVVEYERPLIQKDAVGVPKIVDAEQIVNLPVRGATAVAAIQAGVVNDEGSGTLNVRGGRGAEVTYYIDGVKVVGTAALPQSAVQEQEMIIGNISARYGDAMSGIINITTKSGSSKFFGSFEGITSESLDDFGYNLASVALGGPVVGDNVNFFFAAEYLSQADSNPRAIGQLKASDALINDLREFPTALTGLDADGNEVYIPVPASLGETFLPVDEHGDVVVVNDQITAGDGTVINVPAGVSASSIDFNLRQRADQLTSEDFTIEKAKRGTEYDRLALNGNLNFNVMENVRMRVGGRYVTSNGTGVGTLAVFSPENGTDNKRNDAQFFTTWTHYLSNSTFYQLQVDYTDRTGKNWDPRFGLKGRGNVVDWADFDQDPYATMRGYKNVKMTSVQVGVDDHGTPDPADDTPIMANQPSYTYAFEDGKYPSSQNVGRLVNPPGGTGPAGYFQFHNTQLRFNAMAATQIGIHQVEFGGEFEQQTNRAYSLSASSIVRYFDDANAIYSPGAENVEAGSSDAVTSFYDMSWNQLEGATSYYGYNVFGNKEVDSEDLNAYVNDLDPKGDLSAYNVAPYEPIYYGGYVQDKIEFRDIVLNMGVRVDVFDNNIRVLRDQFSTLPLERAGEVGLATGNIGQDYAVYYNGNDVVGFRDLRGNFFDATGQGVIAGDVLLAGGKPRQTGATVTENSFVDYKPQVTVMPRIGVSFPVTDQALFFARYGRTAQRPSTNAFQSLEGMSTSSGGGSNNDLKPEKTTEYELGFRQRLSARSALTISGFFRQIENLIQIWERRGAYPSDFSTYDNIDFGTVKGLEFDFDLRRTNNVSANVNYTLSFAQGTGSASNTTGTIAWIDETPPNFISPLDFDQRHTFNVSVDYRLGAGEGPTVGGMKLFENFGVNILATAYSGQPYTGQLEPFSRIESKAPIPDGGINAARMPWKNRIDVRFDRKFAVGDRTTLSAFVWIQNLLDAQNVTGVWRATGLPDDDGYLSTPGGQQFLGSSEPVAETMYLHRTRSLGNYGIPRLTRIGVRLDF